MEQNEIKISLLGEFSIKNDISYFPQETKKSMQLIMLIAYLIAHRQDVVTKAQLIKVLWPNDDSNHPEGALRNLIYRARKELSKFSDKEFIISKGNVYAWNTQIPCTIDIMAMEHLCSEIKAAKDTQQVYELSNTLQQDFGYEFMNEFAGVDWVRNKSTYYETMFLYAMQNACGKLMVVGEYEKVIQLCDAVDNKHLVDSHLHEFKLYSYYKRNQISLAISYYHHINDMYYSRLGMEMTKRMKKIYTALLKCSAMNPVNVDSLEDDLNENRLDQGTYYCDFDVFKNIYQVNVRAVRRSTRARFLVLLTLKDSSQALTNDEMKEDSEILKEVIYSSLRKNDIFSKCNPLQYTVIIVATKLEGCSKAVERIKQKFTHKQKQACIVLESEIKAIS